MNLDNILLIIIGVIGIGFWLFLLTGFTFVMTLHPAGTAPERLKWLAIGKFLYLPLMLSIAAIGFGIYSWL
ncbi:hypothetical protein [Chamaesiphon sp. VAR_48_metabat_403]|uniref:hypothetical protein n=1 Tax=Chamaesiphon sp. VAR_48_metabat_403 TaxID=2964700 RepID=UPI00286E26F8|nr:hypothetical protein [Chamaesiphon sp. VAR_48_metabat_403]